MTSHFAFSTVFSPPSIISFLLPEHLVEDPLCKHGYAVTSPSIAHISTQTGISPSLPFSVGLVFCFLFCFLGLRGREVSFNWLHQSPGLQLCPVAVSVMGDLHETRPVARLHTRVALVGVHYFLSVCTELGRERSN